MFNFGKKKKKEEVFKSFASGLLIPLEQVPDQVFSQRMMGDGFAIELKDGLVTAPISGQVTLVFPTGHAIGITTEDGVEVLIHIGIDTVEMKGKAFDGKVKQGDQVSQGDILTQVDIAQVLNEGKSLISPMIFTSGERITLLQKNAAVTNDSQDLFSFN